MTGTRKVNAAFSHLVAASPGGDLLLDYLCRRFPYHTRKDWQARILDGKIRVDGNPAFPETELRPGMRVQYRMDDYEEPEVPVTFREIERRGNVSLVHKPAGLPVHKTGKIFVHTLANLYRLQRGDDGWSPLNRLDVETSGMVAFARGREALKRFSPLEPGTRWIKLYLAVVRGKVPEKGVIEFPLAEKKDDPIRNRMHPHPEGKPCTTWYRALLAREDKTLLLVRPLTGRKHQIRAHFAASGFPIVGDKAYSLNGDFYLKRMEAELTDADLAELGAPHQLLHALHLEIRAEDGEGIQGTDFDLPDFFLEYFPETTALLPGLREGESFRNLCGPEFISESLPSLH